MCYWYLKWRRPHPLNVRCFPVSSGYSNFQGICSLSQESDRDAFKVLSSLMPRSVCLPFKAEPGIALKSPALTFRYALSSVTLL
ncbi:hypothetical protein Y1Q_0024671 [Alligator mississippiensis]|uniref:Uncharacterized protein n=1 Tax=Alligator mississippiensis TaxID=8496 RepID=A0A151PH11_ALLMI|nr:hypothetical protein Y1Q_0024671 [Alligator mississippiensis]